VARFPADAAGGWLFAVRCVLTASPDHKTETPSMKFRFRALLGALIAAASFAAHAQTYPTKPIRLICPFPPGGAVDIASRAIAAEMSKTLGQPVTVENRPGAGGNVGGIEAARSAPDGYTLFMTTSGIQAINPALYKKMPFDPNKDLVPVAGLVSLSNVLVVHPSVKANSVADVLALVRANPGTITYASSGNGTSIHMSGEMFKHLTGTNIVHVPYKGSAPAVTDLLGGQVQMMFDNIPSALPHIKAGKLRALATTGAKRDPALPDLPTIAEAGVAGYESGVWFGLSVPAGTPKEIIAKLNAEAIKGTKSPDFAKRMTELGYVIMPTSPEQMADMIRAEIARWGPVVKASGATVD
jgi:tripartite-type tricarboxylate transporter receptor subunit TctC